MLPDGASTVFGEVDGCERPSGRRPFATMASLRGPRLCGRDSFFCTILSFHFHQIGGIHHIPLTIHLVGEDGTFISPPGEVLHRCRPHPDIGTAVTGKSQVMRADDVGAVFAWIVGVFKHAGFSVGQMLPQREIWVPGGLMDKLRWCASNPEWSRDRDQTDSGEICW